MYSIGVAVSVLGVGWGGAVRIMTERRRVTATTEVGESSGGDGGGDGGGLKLAKR